MKFALLLATMACLGAILSTGFATPLVSTSTTGGGGGVQVNVHVAVNGNGLRGPGRGEGEVAETQPEPESLPTPEPLTAAPPAPAPPATIPPTTPAPIPEVTLFDFENYSTAGPLSSMTLVVPASGCVAFPDAWKDKPSSIRVTTGCVEFFSYSTCEAASIRIGPGNNSGQTLGGRNNDLRSARRC